MNKYKRLSTLTVTGFEDIERPEHEREHDPDSPATDVLTDFLLARPLMIEQSTPLSTAREMMKRAHVRLKLVIDRDENFKGLISLQDLLSVRVMQATERTGLNLAELTVADVMTPRARLHAIDIRDIQHAAIGDLLVTMKSFGDQACSGGGFVAPAHPRHRLLKRYRPHSACSGGYIGTGVLFRRNL